MWHWGGPLTNILMPGAHTATTTLLISVILCKVMSFSYLTVRCQEVQKLLRLLRGHVVLSEARTSDLTPSAQDSGFQMLRIMAGYVDSNKDGVTETVVPHMG